MRPLSIVILAAGQGKRMRSALPKVLHQMAGKPLLEHVIESTQALGPSHPPIIIYGHEGEKVRQAFPDLNVQWVYQKQRLGTGHALLQALPHLPLENRALVLYGDVPLISPQTLKTFLTRTPADALGIITASLPDPAQLGRIVRGPDNQILRIVEEKDATEIEHSIHEVNSGIYLIPVYYLQKWLPQLQPHNAQQELYLTDIVLLAVKDKILIHSHQPSSCEEILGINDCLELAQLERCYQRRSVEKLMREGVTLRDPARFDIRGTLTAGHDVEIDINVIIEGNVTIGNQCAIGPHTVLRDTVLGDHVTVKSHCVIEGARIAEHSVIGPFARLRPGTDISSHVHVGNFMEIKNSRIGSYSKLHHVGYIGDSEIGKQVNIGAGTITCNYDGATKHKTVISDNVFIGSNSELIAPVTIGEGAYIGAGSTITRDAPPHQLTLCRGQQRSVPHWKKKNKEIKEET